MSRMGLLRAEDRDSLNKRRLLTRDLLDCRRRERTIDISIFGKLELLFFWIIVKLGVTQAPSHSIEPNLGQELLHCTILSSLQVNNIQFKGLSLPNIFIS